MFGPESHSFAPHQKKCLHSLQLSPLYLAPEQSLKIYGHHLHVLGFVQCRYSPSDLAALMDYIYTGQTQVRADDVHRFLKTAQELNIKGLVEEKEDTFSGEGQKNGTQDQTSDTHDIELDGNDQTFIQNVGFETEQSGIQTLRKEISNRMIIPSYKMLDLKRSKVEFKPY